ncbi:APC family permease [Dactylosporangium sp. CA-152071]|uniref:APC family permease n=1 Tax=Dactylosporangium sp. CA-152071 TaxID=3239933 RepID=UPI003D8DC6C8
MSARIGFVHTTALYCGALLGPGVLTLPALAAAIAGPGSLLAWAALVAASVPLAATFTALAVAFPNSGGISAVAARAYGPRAFAVIGFWFIAATPLAVYVAAHIGGQYVAAAVGAGQPAATVVTAAILGIVFTANAFALKTSGRVQLVVIGSLVAVLGTATLSTARHIDPANLTPLLPDGPVPVAHACVLLFIAFAGWEAAAHLTDGVTDPARTLPKVAAATVVIVGAIYLGLAATTVGVLGPAAGTGAVPLITLLEHGVGRAAAPVAALVALMLTCGAANTFLAGATRLGVALAERCVLPARIAGGRLQRRSLLLQAALTGVVIAGSEALDLEVASLLKTVSVLLAAVTLAGTSAGILLLPRGWRWTAALTATTVTAAVLGAAGPMLAVPATLAVVAVTRLRLIPAQPGNDPPQPPAPEPPDRHPPGAAADAKAAELVTGWQRHPPHRSRRRKPRPEPRPEPRHEPRPVPRSDSRRRQPTGEAVRPADSQTAPDRGRQPVLRSRQ